MLSKVGFSLFIVLVPSNPLSIERRRSRFRLSSQYSRARHSMITFAFHLFNSSVISRKQAVNTIRDRRILEILLSIIFKFFRSINVNPAPLWQKECLWRDFLTAFLILWRSERKKMSWHFCFLFFRSFFSPEQDKNIIFSKKTTGRPSIRY